MALTLKTPGVYIDEISTIPPAVAGVATAIPGFIGYTQTGPLNTPTRITSLLEYEQNFGVANAETYTVTLSDPPTTAIAASAPASIFTLHYNIQMYFANGGGPCYVVSVGDYSSTTTGTAIANALLGGIAAVEKVDEVTLLVAPEATAISGTNAASHRGDVHNELIHQCAKLKDRFAILDVISGSNITNDADGFRNNEVGINDLKYAAAYYPALSTTLTPLYFDSGVTITDNRGGAGSGPYNNKKLNSVLGVSAFGTLTILNVADLLAGGPDSVEVAGQVFVAQSTAVTPNTLFFRAFGSLSDTATSLASQINSHATASLSVNAVAVGAVVTITSKLNGTAGNALTFVYIDNGTAGGATANPNTGTLTNGVASDKALYNNITALLQANSLTLYPSATIAGIYASVDRDRGVWKAPANVSLTGVVAPSIAITAADQENLNVDATSGKSINVIRTFTGKGVLVWGARTLAGNDNEWRYINVRRLFIFAEESIQKASEGVVFEANDANTWARMKITIGSFLTNLWRDGALAGAKPEQAFFVKVGLGETMTTDDILNGIMNIEIGMAAVRPAEFIVLKFSHKLQEA